MQKLFSVKDKSLYTRSWDPDGSAQDLWDEDYAVINFRGEEVFRTPSRIEAERWIRAETARFFSGAPNPFSVAALGSTSTPRRLGSVRVRSRDSAAGEHQPAEVALEPFPPCHVVFVERSPGQVIAKRVPELLPRP